MGIFSKKNDKNQKARRSSDAEDSDTDVNLENRLGAQDEPVLEAEKSLNSLDFLDDTGKLLERSAPIVGSQGGTVEPWHLPDLSGPETDTDADLGSAESFATFFGENDQAPDQPRLDIADESVPEIQIPASFEATEADQTHDRRLEDDAPMAAASTNALVANSDFLSVEIDDLETQAPPAFDSKLTASELIAAAPPSAITEAAFAEETFSVRDPVENEPPVVAIEPIAAPMQPVTPNEPISIEVDGPTGSRALTLLEILGLGPNVTWSDISATHKTLTQELSDTTDGDPSREAVSRAIQREMNTAYAALRLMAVA